MSLPSSPAGAAAERVLVLPRSVAIPDAWHGLSTRKQGLARLLAAVGSHGVFAERSAMEDDPGFKQVIPYLVLRDGQRWFLMRRTRGGADARLHDRWSIGVGGHVNPGDADLLGGLRREWTEELRADFVPEFHVVGLLNDDETPVGAVHLGVVFVADAHGRPVEIRETHKLEGAFADASDVFAVRDRMETWSRLVFDALTAEDGAPDPDGRPRLAEPL